ncbi:hypothetical protein PVAP13_1KG185277 [Panicum virgatum]|uniref:Uncharacterized protein n=1 Tax=Panicum virgatum TaxID=38727 RepID=A0A8T0XP81_PANVG|nr:hypothetical protein PVAP13_1KG185277 [Panicum virgatum]
MAREVRNRRREAAAQGRGLGPTRRRKGRPATRKGLPCQGKVDPGPRRGGSTPTVGGRRPAAKEPGGRRLGIAEWEWRGKEERREGRTHDAGAGFGAAAGRHHRRSRAGGVGEGGGAAPRVTQEERPGGRAWNYRRLQNAGSCKRRIETRCGCFIYHQIEQQQYRLSGRVLSSPPIRRWEARPLLDQWYLEPAQVCHNFVDCHRLWAIRSVALASS